MGCRGEGGGSAANLQEPTFLKFIFDFDFAWLLKGGGLSKRCRRGLAGMGFLNQAAEREGARQKPPASGSSKIFGVLAEMGFFLV